MKIGFLFGSPKISGGSYVILQHADYLLQNGYQVDLITLTDVVLTEEDIWHPALKKVNFININKATDKYDLVFATWWISPFHLHKVDAKQYAYFVQSIEAYFFEDSQINSQFLAHSSYTLGLPVITEATWIKEDLENRFDSPVFLVKNGIRKEIYTLTGPTKAPRRPGKLRCLVEGPLTSNFKNVARTIEAVKRSGADEIWLLTSTPIDNVPNVDKVFSNVPIAETAEIYRSCDVIIKQSIVEGMFGPPLEMFHCGGTAIVSNVSGHDEYITDNANALVTPLNDWDAVTQAVNSLAENSEKLTELKKNAIQTAYNWPNWPTQSKLFELAIQQIMKLPAVSRKELAYKIQHLLNQNELIKQSLQKYYAPVAVPQAPQSDIQYKSEGEALYFKQLEATIEQPTRLTQVPTNAFLKADQEKKAQAIKSILKASGQQPRVLGLAISNEHIEELWHPIVNKMGWEYQYICSRPKGYFRLYEEIELIDIPDKHYTVNAWFSKPDVLYKTIETFKPNVILLHNGNHPAYQQIIRLIAEKYNIPIIYSELGWFPQKLHVYFDAAGTNANSNLAHYTFEEITGSKALPSSSLAFPKAIAENILLVLQLENDTNFFEFCPHFQSNFDFIEYISASVPKDAKLHIKVHPLDHNAHIYDKFKSYRNVVFVNKNIDELLPDMSAVIAINSTVLLEALDYPVNIYKCGHSILDNKGLVIEFDDTDLKKVWQSKFIDNRQNRTLFKEKLAAFQIKLTADAIAQTTEQHPSIEVIQKAANDFYLSAQAEALAPQQAEPVVPPPSAGKRELPKSLRDIYLAISKYKVISFDVFDTLIVRDIYAPSDIFKYMNDFACQLLNDPKYDHATHRIEAERSCRNNISLINGEVTFDDIYKSYLLRTGLPAHIVNQIKQYEIETELNFLKARKSTRDLFNFAKETGKQVIIVSDFYLDSDFITEALTRAGYDLNGVKLFVSCELHASKKDKKLYDYVAKHLNVSHADILHLGDNFAVDVQNALASGVNSIHYPSAQICLSHNKLLSDYLKLNGQNYLAHRTVSHSIILGLILNEIYDNPFVHPKDSLFNQSAENLGLLALGPLVLTFTDWLTKRVKEDNIDQLLFLARDGWLLQKSFEMMNGRTSKLKSHYLPASRKLMENISYSLDFNEATKVLNARFEGSSLKQLLKLKFNLQESDIPVEILNKAGFTSLDIPVTMPLDKIRVLKLLQQLRGSIIEKAENTRKLFERYLKESAIQGNVRTGLVDIGYFGSMQQILTQLIPSSAPMQGYYLATRWEVSYIKELSNNTHGFVADKFDHIAAGNPAITKRLAYMEQLFSAPHASISSLRLDAEQDKVIPEYYQDTGEKKQHHILNQIHSGALLLVEAYCSLRKKLNKDVFASGYTPDYSDFIAHRLINSGNTEYFEILGDFILENRYNGQAAMHLPAIGATATPKPATPAPKSAAPAPKSAAPAPKPAAPAPKPAVFAPKLVQSETKEKSRTQRLYQKYKQDPHAFFKDSKNPVLKALAVFYKAKN